MARNILLVEYDETTINIIKELFPPPVFDTSIANDGETARKLLATKKIDLMITAAMLPRFHGFNLSLMVAKEYEHLKIIIMSAIYKGADYKHQAISQYRANDFFEKPLAKDKFKKRVLELLNMSENDLLIDGNASRTRVSNFDTSKIPIVSRLEEEEKKLSAEDIFGDILSSMDKVPAFEIDLNEGRQPKMTEAKKEAPRKPMPMEAVPQKKEPPAAKEFRMEHSEKVPSPASKVTAPKFLAEKEAAINSQRIDASLDRLRLQEKGETAEKRMKKIEADIAKKFEDTISGLGLRARAVQQPAPAAKPPLPIAEKIVVPEERKFLKQEIIELGKESMKEVQTVAPVEDKLSLPEDDIFELEKEFIKAPEAIAPVVEVKEVKPIKTVKEEKKPAPEENPNEVGDYVLHGLIARGGMAEIYKAKKKGVKGFEKVIAIKKILSGYGEDDKYIEMLVDEAKIAAELSHPNIVQIYDLGRQNNYYFIAMEYVPGKDLREIQTKLRERDRWFPEDISLYLISKILEALHYAHKAKDSRGRALEIVHRDVSPPNILIAYNGDVKLTDFGVSKASIKIHQTLFGALKGKLLYMSPEQARGEGNIDYRSDLYSVGVVLFELLTGKKLFLDTSEMAVLKKVQNGEIINPRDVKADIDPVLEKIIMKALNKDRDKRYQSAATLSADLEAYMTKKYDYIPGAMHMSHFMYDLFEADILRDGIKVDLKPIPEKPSLREIPKMPIAAEKPLPVKESKIEEPVAPVKTAMPAIKMPETDELMHIDFAEEKIAVENKKEAVMAKAVKRPEPLFKEITETKKKTHLWVIASGILLLTAVLYFLFVGKPSTRENSGQTANAAAAVQKQSPFQEAALNVQRTDSGNTPLPSATPPVDQKALAAERLKQEEELLKQQTEEARKKILQAKRLKQAENERLQKETAERQKQEEEAARLQKEAEERAKQEEQARLQKETEDKKKAEELRLIEQNRVKEGDIVPLGEADVKPSAVSTPDPIIPSNVKETMFDNQIVRFNVLINQTGDVEVARLLQKSNNSQLNTILTNTVKTWKYTPASKEGVRVKVWKTVQVIIKK